MANTKSAKKAFKVSEKKRLINKSDRTKVRNVIKSLIIQIKTQSFDEAVISFRKVESEVMKSVTKKILKLSTASRILRRLYQKVRELKNDNVSKA